MRASQLGVHIGWALSLTRTRAFTSSSVALRSLPKGHAAVAIPQHVARRSLTRSIATRAIPTAGWVKVGISVGTQTCARTRRMWQPSVFMSSAQGMNPESFTERAWDAMVKLPTLADANKAQVVESELLLKTLIDDGPQGLTHRILDKAGVDVSKLTADLDRFM